MSDLCHECLARLGAAESRAVKAEEARQELSADLDEAIDSRDGLRVSKASWKARALATEEMLARTREVLDALLEGVPLPNGDYVHRGVCSGSRKVPVGTPGNGCSCPIGKRIKAAEARAAQADANHDLAVVSLDRTRREKDTIEAMLAKREDEYAAALLEATTDREAAVVALKLCVSAARSYLEGKKP